jgi:hypothetical protein
MSYDPIFGRAGLESCFVKLGPWAIDQRVCYNLGIGAAAILSNTNPAHDAVKACESFRPTR